MFTFISVCTTTGHSQDWTHPVDSYFTLYSSIHLRVLRKVRVAFPNKKKSKGAKVLVFLIIALLLSFLYFEYKITNLTEMSFFDKKNGHKKLLT